MISQGLLADIFEYNLYCDVGCFLTKDNNGNDAEICFIERIAKWSVLKTKSPSIDSIIEHAKSHLITGTKIELLSVCDWSKV